ncbi:GNAT family protein [Sphingobacterium multivorum]|uniref:GNAT family protein n=1 Tax=Sphingobacterium multivorum TaxID=28454 RepID=UPI0011BECEA9|nr:GNAT family protein [Sphingobacterium multivorum]QRQ62097.1 GNAT family N-acetyltransferase [Sphingobacterium multivorum]
MVTKSGVLSSGTRGVLLSEYSAGFKLEGRMREACFRDNQFHDKLFMSVLEEEWNNEVQLSVK